MAGHYFETVENNVTGKPVSGATVLVYEAGATIVGDAITSGTLATVFSDDGVTSIDQSASPITTNSRGFFEFWTNETSVCFEISYDGSAKFAVSDVEIVGGNVSSDVTALQNRASALEATVGVASLETDLGTFTGTTIADDSSVKTALQALETAVENVSTDALLAANNLSDLASAATARGNLGLGTAATLSTADIDERARDALGTALVAGTNITITPNDGGDTITISSSGGGGSGGGVVASTGYVKGTTSGTPGTGAFTPDAAASGFSGWSTVPAGWVGLVRYDDGSAWELAFSYWNGTTLSRGSSQVFASSTGSQISLTSASTATMIASVTDFIGARVGADWSTATPQYANGTSPNSIGMPVIGGTGAGSSPSFATTNYLTRQPHRLQFTSATTANAATGWSVTDPMLEYSTTAGRGGGLFTCNFGASQLPTNPRLFAGLTNSNYTSPSGEPSALTAHYAVFAKDSTDTNIQLLTNDNSGSGSKTDTGIPLVANGWYQCAVWFQPGGGTVYALLVRRDTGAIWFGSRTTDLPGTGTSLRWNLIGGLNGTDTGTAFVLHFNFVGIRYYDA